MMLHTKLSLPSLSYTWTYLLDNEFYETEGQKTNTHTHAQEQAQMHL